MTTADDLLSPEELYAALDRAAPDVRLEALTRLLEAGRVRIDDARNVHLTLGGEVRQIGKLYAAAMAGNANARSRS